MKILKSALPNGVDVVGLSLAIQDKYPGAGYSINTLDDGYELEWTDKTIPAPKLSEIAQDFAASYQRGTAKQRQEVALGNLIRNEAGGDLHKFFKAIAGMSNAELLVIVNKIRAAVS